MEEKKPDRRVLKTKRAIRGAFVELLSRKDIDDITIQEIADLADINRKTFYHYYAGVHQLMDEIENEIVTAFEADLKEIDFNWDERNPRDIFTKLSSFVDEDPEFCRRLLQAQSSSHLGEKLGELLRDKAVSFFLSNSTTDPEVMAIVVDFSIHGILEVYKSWVNGGCRLPVEQVARIVNDIVFNGVRAYLPAKKGV